MTRDQIRAALRQASPKIEIADTTLSVADTALPVADTVAAVVACLRAAGEPRGRQLPSRRSAGPPGLELLLIERATRDSDPWSGQIAFPGGRTEPGDVDELHTALREVHEEVGISLPRHAVVGRLDDQVSARIANRRLRISAFVAWVEGRPELTFDHEVADAFWVPLDRLLDQARRVDYEYATRPGALFPAIDLDGRRVLWGLTLRFFEDLVTKLGIPGARPPGELSSAVSERRKG